MWLIKKNSIYLNILMGKLSRFSREMNFLWFSLSRVGVLHYFLIIALLRSQFRSFFIITPPPICVNAQIYSISVYVLDVYLCFMCAKSRNCKLPHIDFHSVGKYIQSSPRLEHMAESFQAPIF